MDQNEEAQNEEVSDTLTYLYSNSTFPWTEKMGTGTDQYSLYFMTLVHLEGSRIDLE